MAAAPAMHSRVVAPDRAVGAPRDKDRRAEGQDGVDAAGMGAVRPDRLLVQINQADLRRQHTHNSELVRPRAVTSHALVGLQLLPAALSLAGAAPTS